MLEQKGLTTSRKHDNFANNNGGTKAAVKIRTCSHSLHERNTEVLVAHGVQEHHLIYGVTRCSGLQLVGGGCITARCSVAMSS